jgi:hypothetical protein
MDAGLPPELQLTSRLDTAHWFLRQIGLPMSTLSQSWQSETSVLMEEKFQPENPKDVDWKIIDAC